MIFFSLIAGLVLAFATPALYSQSAPREVQAVVQKMASLGSFRANVSIGGASGVLSYSRGKFHLKLGDGRVIASNGRTVVVYNPASRVAGKQPVGGGGGLGWLLSGFDYRVAGNQATGRAINGSARVSEVKIAWSSEYVLTKLSMKRQDSDSWFTITLRNVRPVTGFPAALFSYKPPAGSRTVENPLNRN